MQDKDKTEIGIELKSNKRNLVTKIFEKLDYRVTKLDLVFFGGLTKKDIPRKNYRFLTEIEVNLLKRRILGLTSYFRILNIVILTNKCKR